MEGWKDEWKDGRMNERMDGRLEILPWVLHEIGPLGPLPKKDWAIHPSKITFTQLPHFSIFRVLNHYFKPEKNKVKKTAKPVTCE